MLKADLIGLLEAALAGRYRIETGLGAGAMATVFGPHLIVHDSFGDFAMCSYFFSVPFSSHTYVTFTGLKPPVASL